MTVYRYTACWTSEKACRPPPSDWPTVHGTYERLCTPDGGTVNQVTLPVNTNARKDYGTLRTQLASSERSLHPDTAQVTEKVGRPAHSVFVTNQFSELLIFLRRAQLLYRSSVLRALLCALLR